MPVRPIPFLKPHVQAGGGTPELWIDTTKPDPQDDYFGLAATTGNYMGQTLVNDKTRTITELIVSVFRSATFFCDFWDSKTGGTKIGDTSDTIAVALVGNTVAYPVEVTWPGAKPTLPAGTVYLRLHSNDGARTHVVNGNPYDPGSPAHAHRKDIGSDLVDRDIYMKITTVSP